MESRSSRLPSGVSSQGAAAPPPATAGILAVLEWFGDKAIGGWNYTAALARLVYLSLRELADPGQQGRGEVFRVIARQILFTGVDALPVIGGIALMIGIIIITQAGTQLPKLGAGGLVGNLIVVVVIRELGPLLTAFIIVGRSGTAITTELGNMRVGREVVALELMGIRVSRFIVMPRMVGMVLAMICLTLYFDVVSVLGGFFVAKLVLTVPFDAFAQGITQSLGLTDVLVTISKGVMFGTAVAAICSHHGLSVRNSYTEVPQQTTRAMINSLTVCLALGVLISLTAYLL